MAVKRKQLITMDRARKDLRAMIREKGLTQTEFAKKIGDSPEALSLALGGHRGLSRRLIRALRVKRVIAYERL